MRAGHLLLTLPRHTPRTSTAGAPYTVLILTETAEEPPKRPCPDRNRRPGTQGRGPAVGGRVKVPTHRKGRFVPTLDEDTSSWSAPRGGERTKSVIDGDHRPPSKSLCCLRTGLLFYFRPATGSKSPWTSEGPYQDPPEGLRSPRGGYDVIQRPQDSWATGCLGCRWEQVVVETPLSVLGTGGARRTTVVGRRRDELDSVLPVLGRVRRSTLVAP